MEEARDRVPQWAKRWEGSGYPHPFLMMQITNIRYHDNGSPQAALPDFVRRFNEGNATPAASSSGSARSREFFDRMRAEPEDTLPTMRGDWTDWWNFGAGSTAHETAPDAARPARPRRRARARSLAPGRERRAAAPCCTISRATALALYAEHTWGADRSISHPYSPETRTQQLLKLAIAAEGASVARMLRRDGLERLAIDAGGEEPRLLVYNPHPFPVTAVASPALPAAACRRARSEARLRPRRPGADGPAVAPHPAPGRGDVRPLRRSRLLDRADRSAGALLTSPCRRRTSCPPQPARSRAKDGVLVQRARHRDARPEGRRRRLAQARRRRICRQRRREPARSACRCSSASSPASATRHLRPRRYRIARLAQGLAHGLESASATAGNRRRNARDRRPRQRRDRAKPSRCRMATGSKSSTACCRDDPALQIEAVVDKAAAGGAARHLPAAARRRSAQRWRRDFETGGAAVKLDDEQLPYASRALHHHAALDPASPTTSAS